MNPAIREAIERADRMCQCRDSFICGAGGPNELCLCTPDRGRGIPRVPCEWSGHAAIRNLARVVLEAAAEVADEVPVGDSLKGVDKIQDAWLMGHDKTRTAIIEEIRALMPEEVKQT